MNDEIKQRLDAVNGSWQDAEAKTGASPLPDGPYQATVHRFDFIIAKNGDGLLRLQTEFEVTAPGEHAGRKISTFHALEDLDQISYTKGFLSKLGVENVNPLSDLEERLGNALDTPCEIQVKTVKAKKRDGTEGQFTNVYLNSADPSGQPEVSTSSVAQTEDDDDPIPF